MPRGDDDQTDVRSGDEGVRQSRFLAGEMLGARYRIVAELGRGGMGQVFRAEDTRLGQTVALKFLPASSRTDRRMIDALTAEVRIGRGISHPNVCRLYDLDDDEG